MRRLRVIAFLGILILLGSTVSCLSPGNPDKQNADVTVSEYTSTDLVAYERNLIVDDLSYTAAKLDSMGYVNISDLDSSIYINLVYASPDNFMGEVLYEDLKDAYFLPEVADKIVKAQQNLKEIHLSYNLVIYDAARPFSIQRKMWNTAVKMGKQYYVANPANGGGLHNYGAAVDLSILDDNNIPLPMGTDFDHFGYESNINRETALVKEGIITEKHLNNRLLLRRIMIKSGFSPVTSEWWHFNHCSRETAKQKYALIDW